MAMEQTIYRELKATPGVWQMAVLLLAFLAAAAGAWFYMEHHGHAVTGMDNQIVWGLPHVFAIFLIVAASGALNVASIASVFGQTAYKPMARFSSLLAITLLVGGLAIVVLDLGRADRLIVAMTTYNFSSIFAWNVLLYNGFIAVVAVYLVMQMMRRLDYKWVRLAGLFAFLWRLALTTGTGSIFGWLVARPGYDAAILAPLFIVMSFSFGLAVFILVTLALFKLNGRPFGDQLLMRMGRLLGIFAAAVLYFTTVQHLTNLYAAEHGAVERFVLLEGGIYTVLFWGVQVVLGGLIPIALVFLNPSRSSTILASVLVVIGGFAQLYVIIIGGQAYPLEIFPGYEVLEGWHEGVVNPYTPSIWELMLGLGGVALALFAAGLGAKVLRVLPTNLSDANLAAKT
ncbi:NrfD/PsrC family molybdoenzyme membrane anchor subunit [Maritimibacter sp. HL-12]|uniref:NrfD/PsrC family molybdoenzyme membrane anchor subunit n=1 Tax=Maritimibacter sp. HL-12 TaxID=1162418 RepID=UPI000A0F119B|nr:NrfD/PsrC family molybdoenzyme membrane anchor subunit [Maritimibacter sp. HL-12]SMH44014.1 prokaryotic molybdopterin-containing oxidoreductase family, membrane subunit [Maritimibacter sp. HL-12]